MTNKKPILYVTTSFAPCGGTGSLRLIKQIKYLSKRGWSPVVATTFGLHSSYPDECLLEEAQKYAEIHRAGESSTLWNTVKFYYNTVTELKKRYDFDWMVTTSPRDWDHVIGWWVSRWFDINWHCDLRDPPGLAGYRCFKKWFINQAELLTTAWPTEDLLPSSLQNHSNAHWIPNGYDEEDLSGGSDKKNEKIRFVYTGSIYRDAHDPFPILKIISELKDNGIITNDNCEFLFIGNLAGDSLEKDIQQFLKNNDLEKIVSFQSFSTHKESVKELLNSDVAIIMCFNRAIPYKLVEYIGADKPILGLKNPDSVMHEVLPETERIKIFNKDDQHLLKQVLVNWLDDYPEGGHPKTLSDQFNIDEIAGELEKLYKEEDC